MTLLQTIMDFYPELTIADFRPDTGKIVLKDDGDGIAYIAEWNYNKPLPTGLKIGKSTK